jgi:hypothetical protein
LLCLYILKMQAGLDTLLLKFTVDRYF